MALETQLDLNNYGKTMDSFRSFRKDVFDCIGEALFEITNWETFLEESFKVIQQTSTLSLKKEDLEQAAEIVVKHFYPAKVTVHLLKDDGGLKKIHEPKRTFIEKYKYDVLRTDKLPGPIYFELEHVVKRDLEELSNLITYYESTPFIISRSLKPRVATGHEEAIIQEFYERCIKEQQLIVKHLLKGLKKRALEKSQHNPYAKHIYYVNDGIYDYPYKFRTTVSLFDSRRISQVNHRLLPLYQDEVDEFIDLYNTDKAKFYVRYFERYSVEEIFKDIFFNLSHLPIENNRNEIFSELQKLFEGKNWLPFYALALPQVEGLFTEMCQVAYGKKKFRALSDKVQTLRPLHYWSEDYFDYFQFIVPRQRNKFMHTGFDEGIELKAYDILVDLEYILQVFAELENPLVKVKKLHVRKKLEDFVSYQEYSAYFSLLNDLTEAQFDEIKQEILDFERDFLAEYCNVDLVAKELMAQIPIVIKDWTVKVEYMVGSSAFASGISDKPFKELQKLIVDDLFLSKVRDVFHYYPDDIEKILSSSVFLKDHKRFLPSLDKSIARELDDFRKQITLFTHNVSTARTYLAENPEEPEE
jgi:hypothetical protein